MMIIVIRDKEDGNGNGKRIKNNDDDIRERASTTGIKEDNKMKDKLVGIMVRHLVTLTYMIMCERVVQSEDWITLGD